MPSPPPACARTRAHARAHARTHAHTHTHTRTHAHARTHTHTKEQSLVTMPGFPVRYSGSRACANTGPGTRRSTDMCHHMWCGHPKSHLDHTGMMVWHSQWLCPPSHIRLVPILQLGELMHNEKTPGTGGA